MNYQRFFKCLLTAALFLCALTPAWAQENVILQWNRVLLDTIRTPGAHPTATIRIQRSFSMMHLAMFDAVNSIDGTYTPYLTDVPGFQQASPEAAAAQAAHDVLASLYPTRLTVFDVELTTSLTGIPRTQAKLGRKVGFIVAERMLAARANDGWTVTPPPYVLPPDPGNWQPTPPANAQPTFTHFRGVTPFAMTRNDQFLPALPPALNSAEYAVELNELKSLGSVTSTTRTAEQTLTAQLWASGSVTEILLNDLIRNISTSRNLSTAENARLFALYYMTIHDALQSTNTAQYTYGRWRPITAIRRADEDGNPDTIGDPAWTSLIAAPATPTYSSNASALTGSAAAALELYFARDDVSFQINFGGTPNVIRGYRSFSEMADEAARSRIFGGIHFRSDIVAGQAAGRNVANYVFQTYLRRRGCVS